MDINIVKEFFENAASTWDLQQDVNEKTIKTILENAKLEKNSTILDIACGTGIMIPFYLTYNPKSITAIDISENMIKRAKEKFSDSRISFVCGDINTINFTNNERFDSIFIYNAYPHFLNGEELIKKCNLLLKNSGTFVVAHGASREQINSHHKQLSMGISNELPKAEDLENLFKKYFSKTFSISKDNMYMVCGKK